MAFLSPLFLARRRRRGGADRAAPAEARAGGAREVCGGAGCCGARRSSSAAPAPARAAAAGAARRRAGAAGARVRASVLRGRCAAGHVGVTVVALDTSLSMSAPGPVRARAGSWRARRSIGRRPATWSASSRSPTRRKWRSEPSGDRGAGDGGHRRGARRVRRDAVPRGAVGGRADCSTGGPGTIVVVTDLQESGWDAGDRASVPDVDRIEVADVGAPPPNLAVTARPRRERPDRGRRCATPGPAPRETSRVSRSRRCDDAAPAGRDDECRVGGQSDRRRDACRGAPGAWRRCRSTIPSGIAGRQRALSSCSSDASRPTVLVVTAPAISRARRSTCSRR